MAVRLRTGGRLRPDASRAAADIVDQDRLAELGSKRCLDDAGEGVDATTGRPGHDEAQRPPAILSSHMISRDEGGGRGGARCDLGKKRGEAAAGDGNGHGNLSDGESSGVHPKVAVPPLSLNETFNRIAIRVGQGCSAGLPCVKNLCGPPFRRPS